MRITSVVSNIRCSTDCARMLRRLLRGNDLLKNGV
jgi:hypothetical protein